jgi:hypothetical protein
MKIFISIDGVLRDTIQKIIHHYTSYYLDSEPEESEENPFEYGLIEPIYNDDLMKYFKFYDKDELENFLYIDFAVEIFGQAGISYPNVFTELHNLIYKNKDDKKFTVIGLDHLGKSKPASLFFLSRNGFLGNEIRFSTFDNLENLWEDCDLWITDNEQIINSCPENKEVIKFKTNYNDHFTCENEITKLNELNELWKKSSEENIT